MIRIAVVDDVPSVCTQLEKLLLVVAEEYHQEIEVEPFYSGESICRALKRDDKYDLIFLDIELDQVSGIDVGNFIRYTMDDEFQAIVYISANPQYSLQLHHLHPLDFIIKEIQITSVAQTFKRFLKLQHMWTDTFTYQYGHDIKKIRVVDIRYLKVENRIVTIYMKNSDNLPYLQNTEHKDQFYGTLREAYESQLKQHHFWYLHKAYLVNPAYVANYEYCKVMLTDGFIIPIGSSKRKEIRDLQLKTYDRDW